VQSWQWWKVLLIDADVIIGGLCLIWVVTAFMPEENKVGKREE